jgi:hypothetical protein
MDKRFDGMERTLKGVAQKADIDKLRSDIPDIVVNAVGPLLGPRG